MQCGKLHMPGVDLFFLWWLQDPGTAPARRRWTSLDVGTEIYVSEDEVAEWTLADFDIVVPKHV